jgi:TusE/DsrC/DsvC family sulfur relay protein
MAELKVNGSTFEVNDEGYLVRPADWRPEFAECVAKAHGIELTDRHWQVIRFCREDFEHNGTAPGIRRITKVGKIPTKEIYQLFPGGPGKLAAKVAGLGKPTSCV